MGKGPQGPKVRREQRRSSGENRARDFGTRQSEFDVQRPKHSRHLACPCPPCPCPLCSPLTRSGVSLQCRRHECEGAGAAAICRGEMQASFTRHLGLLKIRAHPKNKRRVFLLLISDLDLKEKERREEKGGCFTPLVRTAVTDISPLRPPRPSSAMEPKK